MPSRQKGNDALSFPSKPKRERLTAWPARAGQPLAGTRMRERGRCHDRVQFSAPAPKLT